LVGALPTAETSTMRTWSERARRSIIPRQAPRMCEYDRDFQLILGSYSMK
jgi:hypothetical protein